MNPISMSGLWILVIIIAFLIELISVGLVSIWFVIGGIVALVAQRLGAPIWVQSGLFLVVSVVSMVLTRPWAIKHLNAKQVASNIDEVIGSTARVVETIDNRAQTGKVLRNGLEWTARTKDDSIIIEKDSEVKVLEVSGVKLIVEKL